MNWWRLAVCGAAIGAGLPVAAQALGPDAAACGTPGATALLVRVHGFKDASGLLRVSTYVASDADWLVSGRYLRRIDVPVPASGTASVCVALPAAGRYGVGVLHDRNGDHKANIFRDGGGFSNNPSIGLSKPALAKVAFSAGAGVTTIDIKLKYL